MVNVGYVALLSFGAAAAASRHSGVSALVIPIFGAGVIVSRTLLAALPDRVGASRTLIAATIAASGGLAVVGATGSTVAAVAGLLVLAVGQGLAVPALGMLALSGVDRGDQGAAAGLFFAYFDAGVGLGGPAVGLAARTLDPAAALWTAAAVLLAAAPTALAGRPSAAGRRVG